MEDSSKHCDCDRGFPVDFLLGSWNFHRFLWSVANFSTSRKKPLVTFKELVFCVFWRWCFFGKKEDSLRKQQLNEPSFWPASDKGRWRAVNGIFGGSNEHQVRFLHHRKPSVTKKNTGKPTALSSTDFPNYKSPFLVCFSASHVGGRVPCWAYLFYTK